MSKLKTWMEAAEQKFALVSAGRRARTWKIGGWEDVMLGIGIKPKKLPVSPKTGREMLALIRTVIGEPNEYDYDGDEFGLEFEHNDKRWVILPLRGKSMMLISGDRHWSSVTEADIFPIEELPMHDSHPDDWPDWMNHDSGNGFGNTRDTILRLYDDNNLMADISKNNNEAIEYTNGDYAMTIVNMERYR